eukprot:340183-Amphidinium_carterae.1
MDFTSAIGSHSPPPQKRCAPLELMAHGGPLGAPQVSADLSTVRFWHRHILAGQVTWPLEARLWNDALETGRGRGAVRNLRMMANRLGWAGARMASGSLGTKLIFVPSGTQPLCFVPKWLPLVLTLKAWLP